MCYRNEVTSALPVKPTYAVALKPRCGFTRCMTCTTWLIKSTWLRPWWQGISKADIISILNRHGYWQGDLVNSAVSKTYWQGWNRPCNHSLSHTIPQCFSRQGAEHSTAWLPTWRSQGLISDREKLGQSAVGIRIQWILSGSNQPSTRMTGLWYRLINLMKRFYTDYNFTTMIFLALKSITWSSYRVNFPWPFQSDSPGLHENQDIARMPCTIGSGETQLFMWCVELGKQQV